MTYQSYNGIRIEITKWKDREAIVFAAGGYEAMMIPEVGANVIRLKDNNRGLDILRTPGEEVSFEQFKEKPQLYGIPILFPPNRIENGKFKIKDRQYEFPINEPQKNNHIHGFLRNVRWNVDELRIIDSERACVKVKYRNDENTEVYRYFPHKFTAYFNYELSSKGLYQKLDIINEGNEELPVGVGFHTAFNAPFHPESKDEDCLLIGSIGKRWELNQRSLPTGNRLDLSEEEELMRSHGINPFIRTMDEHYSVTPLENEDKGFTGTIIEDRNKKVRIVYEMGEKYRHMMIWNSTADKHFLCAEPQSWIINAPNVQLPDEMTGFTLLKTGEKWSEFCKIYAEDLE